MISPSLEQEIIQFLYNITDPEVYGFSLKDRRILQEAIALLRRHERENPIPKERK